MRLAPEITMPKINDSHSWIKEQFTSDMMQHLKVDPAALPVAQNWYTPPSPGAGLVEAPLTANQKRAAAIREGRVELSADRTTQADIAAGRPPSYRVIIQNTDGTFELMEKSPLNPLRWSPDPKAAKAKILSDLGPENIDRKARIDTLYNTKMNVNRIGGIY